MPARRDPIQLCSACPHSKGANATEGLAMGRRMADLGSALSAEAHDRIHPES